MLRTWKLHGRGIDEAVLLVVSELVTKPVRHRGDVISRIRVVLQADQSGLRLGVADKGAGRSCPPTHFSVRRERRGGAVVVEQHMGGGKTVWAGFPTLPAAGAGPFQV
ncbi:hypothetical protein ABZ770_16480 [Streptomyces sp. NPDC006654]|uniref:hypothetical protein n=1 Tax=Streptomyces sp. NPDC006654 TaxID=3156897 RepID=UPI0033C88F0C